MTETQTERKTQEKKRQIDDSDLQNLVGDLYHSFTGHKPTPTVQQRLYAAASSVRTLGEHDMDQLAHGLLCAYVVTAAAYLPHGPARDVLFQLGKGLALQNSYTGHADMSKYIAMMLQEGNKGQVVGSGESTPPAVQETYRTREKGRDGDKGKETYKGKK